MKIRTQLALTLIGAVGLSVFIAASGAIVTSKQIIITVLNAHHERQAQMLAGFAESALTLHAEPLLGRYLMLLQMIPGVRYAYLVDREGKVVMHTQPGFDGKPESRWKASAVAATAVEHESPIQIGADVVARARIGFAKEFIETLSTRASSGIVPPLVVFGILGVALSVLVGLGLAFYVSRPIQQLAAGAEAIRQGNLSVEIPVTASNELGALSRQFNEMAKQLRRLDELKAQFISTVSHDLRSPLGAVVAYANHMLSGEQGPLTTEQATSLQTIRSECQRLGDMVNNILDMAKLDAGRMVLVREPFDVGALLGDVRTVFEFVTKQKGLMMPLDVAQDLPHVLGDRDKTHQVVANLVSNAVKFTKSGGTITLRARLAREGDAIDLSVSDTGVGISAGELPTVFERFRHALSRSGGAAGGTGLGLAICKGLVEAQGGTISIESVVGRGTTVTCRLPVARSTPGTLSMPRFQ